MKAIREARLIGAFLLMIALGVLLRSQFSLLVATIFIVPIFIRWFFDWDEAKYQYSKKGGDKKCM
ncbi:hypothetical protein P0E63_08970 [Enterococcus faecalis]|uniref:hypothetical protein n=1 Tax=Enterococcus TaxID=1350 RepID=UPI00035310CA|nr:hypothetical protein [Enterococcus faecalis]EPH81437.1 hypothetical protein D924_02613 [Enterococcus faecalis 06-MB-S-10]EPH87567.1 hypothetical protein D923_02443 [Enterococcus faecalis 06-MB-S-04]EPH88416.1 hypothetical protein D921_02910 [Enterococcus faecalis F01966]MCU2242700.1 hypothetical protein [Enterococcus faecalis]MDN3127989.1 hypothetical protein [Enterococcus faecalis]